MADIWANQMDKYPKRTLSSALALAAIPCTQMASKLAYLQKYTGIGPARSRLGFGDTEILSET